MIVEKKMDLEKKICRTCMKSDTKLRSIFEINKNLTFKYSDMLFTCASLKISESDDLPKEICNKCVYKLTSLYQFRKSCQESEEALKRNLNAGKITTSTSSFENVLIKQETPEDDVSLENNQKNAKHKTKKLNNTKKSKNRPQQCEICSKFLSCRANLIQHMRRHTGERPYKCDQCPKDFSRAEHLSIHKRIHSGERPHSCETCGKSFVQYAALQCHVRIHTGYKPHVCTICGKQFAQSVTLTYHMRSHTGERPFVCTICGKAFSHSGNLNIHMRFHNNDRPFICTHCGQRFVTSSHLSVHVKHHTGERNYKCDICQKAFIRKEHLRSHMNSHTGQKNHVCDLCGKRYAQSSHLNRHVKTHHKLQGENGISPEVLILEPDTTKLNTTITQTSDPLQIDYNVQEEQINKDRLLQHAITVSLLGS